VGELVTFLTCPCIGSNELARVVVTTGSHTDTGGIVEGTEPAGIRMGFP